MFTRLESRNVLARQVADQILRSTYGRIRDLKVEDVQGNMVIHGSVSSHHMRQLALHGALEILSGERVAAHITVD